MLAVEANNSHIVIYNMELIYVHFVFLLRKLLRGLKLNNMHFWFAILPKFPLNPITTGLFGPLYYGGGGHIVPAPYKSC